MKKKVHEIQISEGIINNNAPYHSNIPFLRRILVNKEIFSESNLHIAVHYIHNAEEKRDEYCKLHSHDVDEINLFLECDKNSELVYEIKTESKCYQVTPPKSIFIPRGVKHSAQAIKGSGLFICILLKEGIN